VEVPPPQQPLQANPVPAPVPEVEPLAHPSPPEAPALGRDTKVSTQWHVHLVSQGEMLSSNKALEGVCELQVQCPNGRKHSSLFAVHLLPHWLNGLDPNQPPQHQPFTKSNIRATFTSPAQWQEPEQVRLSATLSNLLTGEEYPGAIVFSTHPNGHLATDRQTSSLTLPATAEIQALMKIRRPCKPNSPGEHLPLNRLSTLKITVHAEFTRGGTTWRRDFASPGVIKLVSRVQDRAQEEVEFRKRSHVSMGPPVGLLGQGAPLNQGGAVGMSPSAVAQAEVPNPQLGGLGELKYIPVDGSGGKRPRIQQVFAPVGQPMFCLDAASQAQLQAACGIPPAVMPTTVPIMGSLCGAPGVPPGMAPNGCYSAGMVQDMLSAFVGGGVPMVPQQQIVFRVAAPMQPTMAPAVSPPLPVGMPPVAAPPLMVAPSTAPAVAAPTAADVAPLALDMDKSPPEFCAPPSTAMAPQLEQGAEVSAVASDLFGDLPLFTNVV